MEHGEGHDSEVRAGEDDVEGQVELGVRSEMLIVRGLTHTRGSLTRDCLYVAGQRPALHALAVRELPYIEQFVGLQGQPPLGVGFDVVYALGGDGLVAAGVSGVEWL